MSVDTNKKQFLVSLIGTYFEDNIFRGHQSIIYFLEKSKYSNNDSLS